jgi:glycosyltransferase involved in cell wall biosynthesis
MESGGLRTKGIIKQSQENIPLITVITINYNNGNELKETIESVVNQTYQNIEYILIDGGSTDSSVEIIRQYEDRIDYWVSEPDAGIYDAMNKAIDLSTGKWINFMNSGDKFYNETVLESIFNSSREYKDVIYGNVMYTISKNRVFCYANMNNIIKAIPFRHQSCFIEHHLINEFKFNKSYKVCADYDQIYRLYMNNNIFTHIDIVISECKADIGYSSKHTINYYLDSKKIRAEKINYFDCIIVLYMGIKQLLKNILPQKIISYIVYNNIKKKAKKNEAAYYQLKKN